MRKLNFFIILFILFAGVAIFIGNTLFADDIKTIRFGTDVSYPPYEFFTKSGQLDGFDIDIANALCQQIHAKCTFSNEPFNHLIPDLQQGKFDALISAIGATKERLAIINFTDEYYNPTTCYVAPTAKHYSMGDIIGKTIAVQKGSTFEDYLYHKYHHSVTIRSYVNHEDAFNALKKGQVDLLLSDTLTVKDWLKQNDNGKQFGIVVGPLINSEYFGRGFGIAVRKDEGELLNEFNKALVVIKANGVYDQITKKYFGAQ